ncbi:MAG: DUF1292 domain-containing protein [Oscillospiraceae bacterium]|nr:DUF1292 domain-containing protein [Oscillospiraceae bacterium]
MSENYEELDNIVVLTDEEGNEVGFEFIDLIQYQGEEFVVLLPCEDENNEVVILKVEDGDTEEENYVSVDDEDTLMAVFEIFKEKFKDEFTFEE